MTSALARFYGISVFLLPLRLVAVIGGIFFSVGFLLASVSLSIGHGFGYVLPTSVAAKWFFIAAP